MGQKVHPRGFRLGIYTDWDARWFARGTQYGTCVVEDFTIRKLLNKMLERAEVARIEIEKAGDSVRVIIHSGRPGYIIGKKGQGIEDLRKKLATTLKKKDIEISVLEVPKPEFNAVLVAKSIAQQLVRRVNYKKAMKRAALTAMKIGAKGIKICCKGRLGGAEIARDEWVRFGSVPLHTLRSDIDYGFAEARTTYGVIGVKVWICKGEYQHA